MSFFPRFVTARVNAFRMSFNRHTGLDVLSDVTAGVVGSVGVVDRDRDGDLARFEAMRLDKASVDGAARAAAVKQAFRAKGLGPSDGIQG